MAQIDRVTFGFYAPDELREIAVCTITEPRTFDQTNAPTTNGLYDPRLGPTERGLICPTCNQTERHCDGHLGVIELPVPCYNPLLFPTLHKLFRLGAARATSYGSTNYIRGGTWLGSRC